MSTIGERIRFWSTESSRADRVRRDDNEGIPVMGYRGIGRDQPWPGDDTFPFVKDPPETTQPVDYLERITLQTLGQSPTLASYLPGPSLDVGGVSALTLYICYDDEGTGGGISIIPAALFTPNADAEITFPLGVVDSTLIVPGSLDGLAARDVFQTELRWDAGAQQSPAPAITGEECLVLTFDVAPYGDFRFHFAAIGGAVRARAWVGALR